MSLASAEAAAARRQAATSVGYYNVSLGPTAWRFGSGLGLQYNDNINYTPQGQLSDFILSPSANVHGLWPVSELNSLSLDLGGGYAAYVEHPGYSRYFITPDSALAFDLYAGDFWINLHNRLSISQNAAQDPTVVGGANYSQLENDSGVGVTWDLNKVVAQLGYDHAIYDLLSGPTTSRPSGASEIFSASAGYTVWPGTQVGPELGGGLNSYSGSAFNGFLTDSSQWNAGLFLDTQLSQYLHFHGSAGYTAYMLANPLPGMESEFTGFYFQLALQHRINQHIDYTLSAGRTLSQSFFGGAIDSYNATWQANWHIFAKTTLGTGFTYYHGSQLFFSGGEVFDQYGPTISLGRSLTKKLSSSLSYQYYWRTSDVPGRDYTANILSLNFAYTF